MAMRAEFTSGLIIGLTKDGYRNYAVYSCVMNGLFYVSNTVRDIRVGQWIDIYGLPPNFRGEYLLNCSNSYGYERPEILPNNRYTSSKYFPSRNSPEGELLVTARFSVSEGSEKFNIKSYDIEFNHLLDPFNLLDGKTRYYDGRIFIVEAQATLAGFLVLNVVEDPGFYLNCDYLVGSIFDEDIQFFEDSELYQIMTGDGYYHQGMRRNIVNDYRNMPSTSNQNYVSPHAAAHSLPASEQTQTTDSYYLPETGSDVSDVELRRINNERNSSSQTPPHSESIGRRTIQKERISPSEHESTIVASEIPSTSSINPPQNAAVDYDDEIDDEDTEWTLGTSNFPPKPFLPSISDETLNRCHNEKPSFEMKTSIALCVVIQVFEKYAILYTAKAGVQNVLVRDGLCKGIENPLNLGDVAFFEILPRRTDTKDKLLPTPMYSHLAVKMNPNTAESQAKIDHFKNSVRCFGGILEMKVTILLTKPHNASFFYDDDSVIPKSESERKYLHLKASNGVLVGCPTERLVHLLDGDLKGNFDLIAWVSHRKPIGNVSLQIGQSAEVYQRFTDGVIRELPSVFNQYLMNVKK